ncbi:MAG: hypothetical protein NZM35_10955 [Chitinophagales bacterium]|nr:hypothetical protein [Chitinophagales bacterium]MDW8419062.1 hypothetical protein [Chitinophagales bacterium]
MKTHFRTPVFLLLLVTSQIISAADLCVNELGTGGCYSSIIAAIAAASNGDRILIEPKPGGVPYVENFTINKSLQLLSNQEGQKWVLQGNITISTAPGRNIAILHMKNIKGNVETDASVSGTRCRITVADCEVDTGYLSFNHTGLDVLVASNSVKNGYITLRYGNVFGNEVVMNNGGSFFAPFDGVNAGISYLSDGTASDTFFIVGNRIINNVTGSGSTNYGGISINNTGRFQYVANNYYYVSAATGYNQYGIYLNNAKNDNTVTHKFFNNTVRGNLSQTSGVIVGLTFYLCPSLARFEVYNNLVLGSTSAPTRISIHYASSSSMMNVSYNISNLPFSGLANNGTNNLATTTTINPTTAQIISGDAINGGHPDPMFSDHDLTRNDAGVWGGSYSHANFFPLPVTGAARVAFVRAPNYLLLGDPLNIRGNSFDR